MKTTEWNILVTDIFHTWFRFYTLVAVCNLLSFHLDVRICLQFWTLKLESILLLCL